MQARFFVKACACGAARGRGRSAKLEVLREAAGVGFGALDRGEFKEFDSIDDLQAYLNGVSEEVISRVGE
jgi:antitoxin ParD1/3/4